MVILSKNASTTIAIALLLSLGAIIFFYAPRPARRPQVPARPYPYRVEEVTFTNVKANITLAGTLTVPSQEGRFPAVILITGSGPQNRNEEIAEHKPFLVIADHLTRNGIAVLRYDDRGVGQSTGDFAAATTEDFATDAASALAYLKTRSDIDNEYIGLMGHSEGGIVAPMVAATEDVGFVILLAAPGIKTIDVLRKQQELIARAAGATELEIQHLKEVTEEAFQMILSIDSRPELKENLARLVAKSYDEAPKSMRPPNLTKEQVVALQSVGMSSPWYRQLLRYDTRTTLQLVTCPLLALNGEKDLQVSPRENLEGIREALKIGGNEDVTTIELPHLNHLFQDCKTGSPSEYQAIEQTFSPIALDKMTNWILKRVDKKP